MTPRRDESEAGYTLIELMIAASICMFVVIPAMALLTGTLRIFDQAEARIAFNQQARQAMRLIGDGGFALTGSGKDKTSYAYGLHGRNAAFAAPVSNHRLSLTNNGITIDGDRMAPVSVPCKAKNKPITGCKNASDTQSMQGWLDGDLSIDGTNRSIKGRTAEVSFAIVNPYRRAATAMDRETYRAIFTLNRDEVDP